MTIYQEEMQRRANKRDCYCYPHEISGDLQICYKGRRIGEVSPEGNMRYPKPGDEATKALIDQLCEDAKLVREYVGIYESAPPMICADVPKYRKFSEFNNIVFAGMYSRDHGFMFCTWAQGDNGRYLTHGHYTQDYESAKEDYATRANLIGNARLFDLEQSIDLHKCVSYARDYCDTITYEKDRDLMALQDKILDAYPQLEENPPTFDEGVGINPVM